jgi:hypothetical protein
VLAPQMAAHDVGKVPGSRVEIVSADHRNKPDIGAGIARQWIDVDHVDAIVDVPTSSVAFGGSRGHSLNWDLLAFCSGDDFTGAAAWTKAQGHQEVTTC